MTATLLTRKIETNSLANIHQSFPNEVIPGSPMAEKKVTLCETIKRLGYVQNGQVKLYGEIFRLISDPVIVEGQSIFVDAVESKSGALRRIRIPLPIVLMAEKALEARDLSQAA